MRRRRKEVQERAKGIVGKRTKQRRFTNTMADVERAGKRDWRLRITIPPRRTMERHEDGWMVCMVLFLQEKS